MTSTTDNRQEQSTYDWLIDALGGEVEGPGSTMLARPSAAEPELLIPLDSRRATAASLLRNHDDRSLKAKAVTTVGRTVGRSGLMRHAPGEVVHFPTTAVEHYMQALFGDPTLQLSIGCGPRRRNRKPVIMAIRDTGELAGFAKVGWSPFTRSLVENEHRIIEMIDGAMAEPIRTPVPLALAEDGECLISVSSALRGSDWGRKRTLLPEEIDTIGTSFSGGTRAIGDLGWLVEPRFGTRTDDCEIQLEAVVEKVRCAYAKERLPVGLWHGDLNRWNMISNASTVGVIDWEFGGTDRPIGQDRRHLRFESIRRSGNLTPEQSIQRFLAEELRGTSTDAEVAVYLADLAIRESRLSTKGFSGGMAGFRRPLTAAMEELLL